MNYPIKKYNNWLLEDKSKRFVEKEGETKVVFKPLDSESFLIKYRKLAIIDANQVLIGQPKIVNGVVQKPKGQYLNTGWSQTFDFLVDTPKGKGPNIELIETLKELGTSKILVYEVSRKLLTPNKIVVTFTIYDKSQFKPPIGADEKGVIDKDIVTMEASTAAQYAIDNATAAKIKNTVLNFEARVEKLDAETETNKNAGSTGTTGAKVEDKSTGITITVKEPYPVFSQLRYANSKSPYFKIIDQALSKISRFSRQGDAHPEIHDNDKFKKSEDELDSGRIGDYVITVLTALKRAYKIVTQDSRGKSVDLFSQEFATKLANIINAKDINDSVKYILDPFGKYLIESAIYEEGDELGAIYGLGDLLGGDDILNRFIEELKKITIITTKKEEKASTTPEELNKITYPLKYGDPKNDDLKKVQRLILDKFEKTDLGGAVNVDPDKAAYTKFTTRRDDGDYGPNVQWAVDTLGYILAASDNTINTNAGKEINKKFVDALYKYNTPPSK